MASIVKKIKKGHAYYYAVQSQRVNGKPRIVWQKYLGTIEAIMGRADAARPPKPKEVVIFEAGGVAALAAIARRLGLAEIVDAGVPKREQGPSVGQYILLAAINRALAPCSKLAIGDWYEQTVLRRLWGFGAEAFTSQRFWDHMDRIEESHIEAIQERLLAAVHKEFGLDGGLLLYDTTNFYTYIATTNDRCPLTKRGRNKQKRLYRVRANHRAHLDLRQYGLALLLAGDSHVPVLHRVYEGNLVDAKLFPAVAQDLLARYRRATGRQDEVTMVFDKGNVSREAIEALARAKTHFVAAVPANWRPALLATPLEKFEAHETLPGTQVFEAAEDFWGETFRVAVTYTESFFTQQLHGLTQTLVRCQKKLLDLAKSLEAWREGKKTRGKRPTLAGVRRSVQRILSAQFMKEVLLAEATQDEKTNTVRLTYRVDHDALGRLARERLGRALLLSSHIEWNAPQLAATYRSLSGVEDAFRNMKDVDYLRWQPAYHWTDQKLRVHGLYCVMALLLATLARKVAAQGGVELPLLALLDELTAIHEVAVVYPQGTLAHRKDHIALSRMTPRQKKLAEALHIAETLAAKG
jgi:transposase